MRSPNRQALPRWILNAELFVLDVIVLGVIATAFSILFTRQIQLGRRQKPLNTVATMQCPNQPTRETEAVMQPYNRQKYLTGASNQYKKLPARITLAMLLGSTAFSTTALADEAGVSFWLPGQFGSLAAIKSEPGWSLPVVYYHASAASAGGKNFVVGGRVTGDLNVRNDLMLISPTYDFTEPLWGGQAQVILTSVAGKVDVNAGAALSTPTGAYLSRNSTDALTGMGDLYPTGIIRWNNGNHNWLTYTEFGVPVGSYEVGRLANLGLNHWSADAGGGYTYLNPVTGREFSFVAGITYNFRNPGTDYQNGISSHLDWGASQFLSKQLHAGLVGYFYNQLTGDSGTGARLGDFMSRVNGIGPQIGYLFKIGEKDAYVNLKGYKEFNAQNRPEGWNAWLTLSIPLDSSKR